MRCTSVPLNGRKAFSLVEIIIAVSIITLLAVIWFSSKAWWDEAKDNTKVISDTKTINNALESYSQENPNLPMPGWNTNFYASNASYMHSYDDTDTFWVYGSLTEETIAKKYLDVLPLDPRTNSYYAYGKTKASNQFEIASVHLINWDPFAKVIWNYTGENGPYNLIREYNWSDFVYNDSTSNLPYNPEELVLIVTDENWKIYREWDTIDLTSSATDLEIYFSDGSTSVLEAGSELTLNKLNFKNDNNLNTLVKLVLSTGTIWTKATNLNQEWDASEFEVYTSDSTAAVRGTIFSVKKTGTETETVVIEWNVELFETINYVEVLQWQEAEKWANITTTDELKVDKSRWEKPKVKIVRKSPWSWVVSETTTVDGSKNPPAFKTNKSVRSEDSETVIRKENDIIAATSCRNPANDKEIIDWDSVDLYNTPDEVYTSPNVAWDPCVVNTTITRTCNNWILEWDDNYKYESCVILPSSACNSSTTFLHSGDNYSHNWILALATWTGVYIEPIPNWNITHKINIECDGAWGTTYVSNISDTHNCNDHYSLVSGNCIADTQNTTCQWSRVSNSIIGTFWDTYPETWDWSSWIPDTTEFNWEENNSNYCDFDCDSGYTWDSWTDSCKESCPGSTYTDSWSGVTYTRTNMSHNDHQYVDEDTSSVSWNIHYYSKIQCLDGTISKYEPTDSWYHHMSVNCNTGYSWNSTTEECEINAAAICNTVEINWVCQTTENNIQGWNLVAFAPYNYLYHPIHPTNNSNINNQLSYKMYTTPWVSISLIKAEYLADPGDDTNTSTGLITTPGNLSKLTPIDNHNFYKTPNWYWTLETATWIYLDKIGNQDKLKYHLPSNIYNNDFIIEISVRWAALKKSSYNYLLIFGDLKLFKYTNGKLYFKDDSGSTKYITNSDITSEISNDNKFYKVIIKKIWSSYELKLWTLSRTLTNITLSKHFYVWYGDWNDRQWDDIIDYVKIYQVAP